MEILPNHAPLRGEIVRSSLADSCRRPCQGLESADQEDFQVFALEVPRGFVVEKVQIQMLGTVSGGRSFNLLDARIMGTTVANPTKTYRVSALGPRRQY